MRIAILTVAFNEREFIVPCIKQFDGFNFPHLILVSSKPWRGDYQMDETWALAKMHNKYGDVNIDHWPNQAAQFNWGLEVLQGAGIDWALIVDADEFYTAIDIGRLVGEIRNAPEECDAFCASDMSVYWKAPDYKIIPRQLDTPIIAIKANKRFTNKRAADVNALMTQSELHHMSYVRTDEQMKKKIEVFEHSDEFNKEFWYNKIWLPWTPDSIMLHPVVPRQFKRAIYHPAPTEIRRLINWKN